MRSHRIAAMLVLGLTAAMVSAGTPSPARAGGRALVDAGRNGIARAPQWGGRIAGRWWAGSRAPGGWGAYQRPLRGSRLPAFWAAPRFRVVHWSGFDLPPPTNGHVWSRYYDDAVLIDDRGVVHDTIGGVDWDRFDPPGIDYAYREDLPAPASADRVAAAPPLAPGAPYAPPPRRATEGARVASIADAGRSPATVARVSSPVLAVDDRLTLANAPVTAGPAAPQSAPQTARQPARPGAGYPPPPPGAVVPRPGPQASGYPPAVAIRALPPVPEPLPTTDWPPLPTAPPPVVTATNGARVTTTTVPATSQGYHANGYYFPPPTVVTVTIQPMPATPPR